MVLVYFSKTGNIKRFMNNLNQNYFKQIYGDETIQVNDDIILCTYTAGLGEVPKEVEQFCQNHKSKVKYVLASGNQNFGDYFALSGDLIADKYNAKLLYKFELSGTKQDIDHISALLKQIQSEIRS